jgi:hypothetical protein
MIAADLAKPERLTVVTHQNKDGTQVRTAVEFEGQQGRWTESLEGRRLATFVEVRRARNSIFLFDAGRSTWLRLDLQDDGHFASGYWARGTPHDIQPPWTPLDPVNWRG